jgi:cyclic beta-1,2-glucan synthetase
MNSSIQTPRPHSKLLRVLRSVEEQLTETGAPEGLYTGDQLEKYAEELAFELQAFPTFKKGQSFRKRLKQTSDSLTYTYAELTKSFKDKHHVSPAGEWFVDNFHLIENQIRDIKANLPENYYYGLPMLLDGELKGFPRVYAIALAFLSHSDGRLDPNSLSNFLSAFQRVAPLKIAELWALSLTLRVVLVEHLSVLARGIVDSQIYSQKGDALAETLLSLSVSSGSEKQVISLLEKEFQDPKDLRRPLLVQMIQRLRDQNPNIWPALEWMEAKLKQRGSSIARAIQLEHSRQAADQVTIGNIIGSMRSLSNLDWRVFFENHSLVDEELRRDPAQIFSKMDFATRDLYRHSVERIAKRGDATEIEVARASVFAASTGKKDSVAYHIGHYLLGAAKHELEANLGYRPRARESLFRKIKEHATAFYLLLVACLTALLIVPLVFYYLSETDRPATLLLFLAVAIFPASELAISLINHYLTRSIRPESLPRLSTEKGIPTDSITMIVIPTLLTKASAIKQLVERLEIHALGNTDPSFRFALLTDWVDASQESQQGDDILLGLAKSEIEALNDLNWGASGPKFFLFHRKRRWNEAEGAWIGWERKRGKLEEFNELLAGSSSTSFVVNTAPPELLKNVKHVITLDSDTNLPRDAARKLVGTILHPLNQPVFCETSGKVISGYGILQPRISINSDSAAATRFSQLSSGNIGLDPYTTAVSDVYQDLFSEGSYTGKGLYVVDAFRRALHGRVPENTVLSHDLFEGSFARTALVTDIELYDDYPGDYETFSKRQHRWTRGDWQIASWLFPWVRNETGQLVRNNLSLIAKWKIFDNLRRSLVPAAALLWLFSAWLILPGSATLWSLLVFAVYLFPIYSTVATGDWARLRGNSWQGHFLGLYRETKIKLGQILLSLLFLPQQAITQLDAVARALYRLLVSKKHLLEWTTFQDSASKASHQNGLLDYGLVTAIFVGALTLALKPTSLPIALPFLILWCFASLAKSWLRKPSSENVAVPLSSAEESDLRYYARSTWHFFERFVTKEYHFLAPDNFQEDPEPVVAQRTSPTNIGLQLLAGITAYDLGYLSKTAILDYIENTVDTLLRLPTMHGHLFNWIDTKTLLPLQPRYVSTVDSGNLAGHLLALNQFLEELPHNQDNPIQEQVGQQDTCLQLRDAAQLLRAESPENRAYAEAIVKIATDLEKDSRQRLLLPADLVPLQEAFSSAHASGSSSFSSLGKLNFWIASLEKQILGFASAKNASGAEIRQRCNQLSSRCREIAYGMDFRFLYDQEKKLFVIGYNVNERRKDNSYYDLLASESRLASFFAVAKGDVPQEHWFRLGRRMASFDGGRALVAWTATMFEYLMPLLVMRRYPETLLDETYENVVRRQISYGLEKQVPWGISESGYNARDRQLNYQYGPFGVPGLGLKRGLSEDLVISPYSTALAAQVLPQESLQNLRHLRSIGALGQYGFYEALDFTADRLKVGQKFVTLKSYMAHHQGMSLVSFGNALKGFPMHKRFHAEPAVRATELLLQERVPLASKITSIRQEETDNFSFLQSSTQLHPRIYSDVNLSRPRTQILSNGSYHVMLSSTGSGFSRRGPIAINRWREDATRDPWGQFFYLRKHNEKNFWSAAHQPLGQEPLQFGTTFAEEKVDYWRRDKDILTRLEVIVSPEDDVELRRISLTNESEHALEIEITSFMELVLAKPADDTAHPAFSNLFVQTEYLPAYGALLGTRRARSSKESPPWGFHVAAIDGHAISAAEFETDRARFLGRGRDAFNPEAIVENKPLSNSSGSVLDPIFSLRRVLKIPAGETSSLTFCTGFATTKETAIQLIEKYREPHLFAREAELAWTQAQVQLRHLNISNAKAHLYQRLAGRLIYLDSSLRPGCHILEKNSRSQTALWAYGISGDLPILLTRIADEKDIAMVRDLLHAHEYLRLKGLVIDLVILNERPSSYLQTLQEEIQAQIRMSGSQALMDQPGGIFLRRLDIMPSEDISLLRSVARVTLNADRGNLEQQLKYRAASPDLPPLLPSAFTEAEELPAKVGGFSAQKLQFFNGFGGFSDSGDYTIRLQPGQSTPAPWINVIANSLDFGCLVSETGAGYTWSANSRENRISPWSNDPLSDPPGEAFFIRDESTGKFWNPLAGPSAASNEQVVIHSKGLSTFKGEANGIRHTVEIFVSMNEEVKFTRINLSNTGKDERDLSITAYVEWVLGFNRSASAQYIIPSVAMECGALLAKNPYNNEFADRVAFFSSDGEISSFTGDRREFLGRNGHVRAPAALNRIHLSNNVVAGLDPCAALQTKIKLAPGETRTVTFSLGQKKTEQEAKDVAKKFKNSDLVEAELAQVRSFWKQTTNALTISTPDPSMDMLVNHWLVYQTLSCRYWARTAFYQSGGAFGFRDQLQDVMALLYTHPEIAKKQLLIAGSRQFLEGDVQHWWHPPTGRGVRTHFSDDLLWLPLVMAQYVKVTGDHSVLQEQIPFITAPLLAAGQDDAYTHPTTSAEMGTLLEHCIRAIDRSLRTGAHSLPLMGSGDWNDGMNRVGHEGKGESVWVAWFLCYTLKKMMPLLETSGVDISKYEEHMTALKAAIEASWDGDWYRRAYFDDGTPLGSAANEECRIDSISQSWAVISGVGDETRARRAMAAVDQHLVRRSDGLIQLFTPPFDKSSLDPGYIKGYVPGVRENGGQYTHAAIWTLMAYAELGDGDKAVELFSMLNPINHSLNRTGAHKYKVEPYVIAADVYGRDPHIGRGGWTWYTGSSSWMYRAAIESILGLEVDGNRARLNPHVPGHWDRFSIQLERKTSITILARRKGAEASDMKISKSVNAGNWFELNHAEEKFVVEVVF